MKPLLLLSTSLCLQGCFSWLQSDTAKDAIAGASPLMQSRLNAQEEKRLGRNYPQTMVKVEEKRRLSLQDVIRLTKVGIPDDKIIALIQETETLFYLTIDDRYELKIAGVSHKVIDAMEKTSRSK